MSTTDPTDVKDTQQGTNKKSDLELENAKLKAQLEAKEKMFKDTQASYTQKAKALKKAQAEAEFATKFLDESTKDKLEDLKLSDPDAWHKKLTLLEQEKNDYINSQIEEHTKEITTKNELSIRAELLAQHNVTSKVNITDEVLANDVPPRIHNKLASGEIKFDQYLSMVEEYLTTGKVVAVPKTIGDPTLGDTNGGVNPIKQEVKNIKSKVLL